ncbi:MAG TPA: hypothetical protein VMY99_05740 [Nevskiaceae bacterium]|nr:hypothetical protein [Nevskiaceae bacterium]
MRPLIAKIKPASGFAGFAHLGLNILLPLLVFILVRIQFIQLALAIILLSKWRMFAVRPRFWPVNIRANAIDIIVGISILLFMIHSGSQPLQFMWAFLYGVWLVSIKPASTPIMVSLQAMIGFLCGLMALFVAWASGPLYGLVLSTGLICYLAARHFFDSFDEPYAKLLSYTWAYFGAALVWVLGHWLLFYGLVSQPALLLLSIGYGLGVLYYLDHHGKLSQNLRRQFLFIMLAIVLIVVVFSDWGGKIV